MHEARQQVAPASPGPTNKGSKLPARVVAVGAIALAAAIAGAAMMVWTHRGHEQAVNAALTGSAICQVQKLSPADVEWLHENSTWRAPSGIDESRASIYESRMQVCRKQEERAVREKVCAQVANALESRRPPEASAQVVGAGQLETLRRVAAHRVGVDDLRRFGELPCADTSDGERVRKAFLGAARELGPEWISAGIPQELKSAMEESGLASAAAEALRRATETQAAATGAAPTLDELNGPVADCDLTRRLAREDGPHCKQARDRRSALLAKLETADKAREARCEALKRKVELCTTRCEAKAPTDELGFSDFDKGLDCAEQCEKSIPLGSCE